MERTESRELRSHTKNKSKNMEAILPLPTKPRNTEDQDIRQLQTIHEGEVLNRQERNGENIEHTNGNV